MLPYKILIKNFINLLFQEREKLREEKRKYMEYLKQWSKPREDMECDDLKVYYVTFHTYALCALCGFAN